MAKLASLGTLELHGEPVDDVFMRSYAMLFDAALIQEPGDDLATHTQHAFEQALWRDPCDAATLIGIDCRASDCAPSSV